MRLNDDYVKITYQTPPIGPSEIVLYLTTFDIEKYKKDQEIETKTKTLVFEDPDNRGYNSFADVRNSLDNTLYCNTDNQSYSTSCYDNTPYYEYLQNSLNNVVMRYYEPYVEELKRTIDVYKKMINNAPKDIPCICKGDITNADMVECDTIQGDVVNCKEVHCKEIKGDTINCRVYKENEK